MKARAAQIKAERENPTKISGFEDATHIILDPGNDILCDSCNVTIETVMVRLVEFGRRTACEKCYAQHYADEPTTWKMVDVS